MIKKEIEDKKLLEHLASIEKDGMSVFVMADGRFRGAFFNGTENEWTPAYQDYKNYNSIGYSLDNQDGKFKTAKGLYTMDGFVAIDDSVNFVIENETFIKREPTSLIEIEITIAVITAIAKFHSPVFEPDARIKLSSNVTAKILL